jgi:hypothetical protein
MIRRNLIVGTIILVAVAAFSGPSLSQTQRTKPYSRSEAIRKRIEKLNVERSERVRRQREQAIKQAKEQAMERAWQRTYREMLEATDAQWAVIMPKLKRVCDLQREAGTAVTIKNAQWVTTTETSKRKVPAANITASNTPATRTTRRYEDWRWVKPWEQQTEVTRAQKACDELVALFRSADATDEQKAEKMSALRQARQDAARRLGPARRELREALTLRQEAILVLIGLLD